MLILLRCLLKALLFPRQRFNGHVWFQVYKCYAYPNKMLAEGTIVAKTKLNGLRKKVRSLIRTIKGFMPLLKL